MSTTTMDYKDFLRAKADFEREYGQPVEAAAVNPILKEHQRDLVRWAVEGGRRAIFAAFGMGKSIMQLETLRLTLAHAGGRALIIAPLGVRGEFIRDGRKLDIDVTFIRRAEDMAGDGIYITNYETVRDGKLDVAMFTAVSLDEAGVLRSFGSKTYQTFLTLFEDVPYRFVATATPSPNRYKELIHYAGFLGVMDTGQALTRFFQRDSTQANNLTLYPHKREEFFMWLNSWSIFLQKPSDLGYSDEGYDLPPLTIDWVEVPVDHSTAGVDRDGQVRLFRGGAKDLQGTAREKRDTINDRIRKAMELVDGYVRSAEEGVPAGVLPEEPGTDPARAEGTGLEARPEGGRGVPEGLLRAEQAETAGAPAGTQPEELPAGSGIASCTCRPMEGGEPGTVRGNSAGEPSESTGGTPGDKRGVVSGQQGNSQGADSDPEAGQLRSDAGIVPGALGISGPCVCDLREPVRVGESEAPAVRGPLSRDGEGSGPALQSLQRGAGPLPGQPGTADGSGPLFDQVIIWCHLNDEQAAVERALKERGLTFSSVHGSLTTDEAERRLEEWRDHKTYALIGKPVQLGQGLNLQQSNKAIFVGVDYRFNDVIQACHRIQRFGQTRPCTVHLIHAESEGEVVTALKDKWAQHRELTSTMTDIIKTYGLSRNSITEALTRSMGVERIEASGPGWTLANNDCVDEATNHMGENSVDMVVTSIPFSNHYEYTPSYNDFGHTDDNDHFWAQMDFLTPQLLRVMKPGRIYACHVKDRINFGNVTGAGIPTVSPFHAEALFHGVKHGFDYMGMITVVTDVVRENNQTYRLGYTEMRKDGTKMGVGSPEYILLFHKPQTDRSKGYADDRVTKEKEDYSLARWQVDAHANWRSSGDRHLTTDELAGLPVEQRSRLFTEQTLREVYDYESHIKVGEALQAKGALPATFMSLMPGSWAPDVWHDVNRMLTLNGEQKRRNVQMHVCPLQFDIVDRLIERYTNPGDLVYDPFGGLGTVPLRALKLGRKGRSSELNTGYFLDSVKYLEAEERKRDMPSLFDLEDLADAS
jgi:hypothetical protein